MAKERLDIEIDSRKFEKLKDFIDDYKNTRKSSKRFYGEQIAEMAYKWMRDQQEKREMEAREFQEVEQRIRKVIE